MSQGENAVLVLQEALVLATVSGLQSRIEPYLMTTDKALTIDLSGVNQFDSAALALFLEWIRQLNRCARPVLWVGIPKNLKALADLYGVAFIFEGAEVAV